MCTCQTWFFNFETSTWVRHCRGYGRRVKLFLYKKWMHIVPFVPHAYTNAVGGGGGAGGEEAQLTEITCTTSQSYQKCRLYMNRGSYNDYESHIV